MKRSRVTLLTAIAPAVWGTTYVVTTQLLPPAHPLFASLVRALPAGLIAIALTRALPTGAWWWRSAVLGVLNIGAFFPLLFVSAYHLPGGVAATLGAVQPLVVAVLVIVVLREPFSTWRLSWGVIGFMGVALVVLRSTATLDATGIIAGLLGAVSMGLGVTLTKKWGRPAGVPAMGLAGWQLTAGGVFLLPLTLIIEGVPADINGTALAGYAWLGLIGGLLTYTLWFRGIALLPVASVAVLGLLSPLVAATLGALLLGQNLGNVQLVGFALALAAIAAGQITPTTKPDANTALGHTNPGRPPTDREDNMRIAIIGATGTVGSRIATESVRRGHDVSGVSRTARDNVAVAAGVTLTHAEATDAEAMGRIATENDVIVLATRPTPGAEHTVSATVTTVLGAALTSGRRVIVIGGAGPLRSPDDPNRLVIDDPRYVPEQWRTIARASIDQLTACASHSASWTYLSPPALLEPGTRTGIYRRGGTELLVDANGASRISAEDLAVAVLDEIENPQPDVRHFTVAY